jgi:O-antigen/teichoic acid export membrane protein
LEIINFIKSFFKRQGGYVLFSVFFAKFVNFLIALVVIWIISKEEYGLIAYGLTILSFLAPFVGAGVHQGLTRYGSISKSQSGKKILFRYALKKGLQYTSVLIVLVIALSPFLNKILPGAAIYLAILSFQLLSLFLLQMIQIYCRLLYLNKLFAQIDMLNSSLLLLSVIIMCSLFGGIGYVISLIAIPIITSVYFIFKLKPHVISGLSINDLGINKTEFLSYGLYISFGSVIAQLLFAVDIIIIGIVLKNAELVAQYKASNIIPFSFLIIASAVMATDFVKLARASEENTSFLKSYYLNYLKLFSVLGISIVIFFYFASDSLMNIFGAQYEGHPWLMFIFSVGVVGGMMFRVPMGNMLSAIGWPKTNALFSIIVFFINIVGSYFMILRYGIEGAAITTSALMWLSGLLSLGAFIFYLKRKAVL